MEGAFTASMADYLMELIQFGKMPFQKNSAYAAIVRDIYQESPYAPGILMSGNGDDPSAVRLIKATEAYSKNQYAAVTEWLNQLPETGRTDALKLRAHANFRLQQYDQAAADFEALTKGFAYRNDAEWYLLLCHAALLPKSQPAFETLMAKVNTDGHPFEMKALALKNMLAKK